jgi:hypothetical protein
MIAVAAVLAALLALVHMLGGSLRFLRVVPRSRFLSAASGVSVAYVFVHILPDLAQSQENIREAAERAVGFAEHHVYQIALVGMMVFYGLERLANRSRARSAASGGADTTEPGVFWIHVSSFALYNALIGYLLLHREKPGLVSLLFFFAAMATHFLVNDFGLRQDHKYRYDRYGRWLLAAAVVAGWAVGAITEVHRAVIAVLFSFLAGGVILNVLKEELPEEQEQLLGVRSRGVRVRGAAHRGLAAARSATSRRTPPSGTSVSGAESMVRAGTAAS